ncbi:hypothetical protein N431DRAFT_408830 [Stipitochalara longipes BDJ]|nr:hypothetical protein N431DRAFT_408830 [Stipitochalara longipes BDJ]
MAVETHGPLLAGVSWLLVVVSCIFLCLRIYCKFVRGRGLWWDDAVLISAWVCLCVDTCFISVTTSMGFGRHFKDIDPKVLPYIGLLGNFSSLFAILAAMLSKISFALTLFRISEFRMRVVLCFIIGTVFMALGTSALMGWIQCTPIARNWDYTVKGTCWNPQVYVIEGMVSGAYGGCMDMVLALLPWKMIWGLQMKKKEKFAIALAMSMGIFAGAMAIIKTVYMPQMANEDFSYIGVPLILWGQTESAVCIIAASIPLLRVMLRNASGKYFNPSLSVGELGDLKLSNGPRSKTTTAITSGGRTMRASGHGVRNSANDDDGRGILNNESSQSVTEGGIVQSTEIAVEYHYGNDLDGHEEFGFELRKVGE